MAAAFTLCFGAYRLLIKRRWGSAEWTLAISGAIVFRLTMLAAGLPPDLTIREKVAAMHADWRGESVTYERFQLFDDDVWRYLWDAHVAASGIDVYSFAPADSALDTLAPPDTNARPDWETVRENINYPKLKNMAEWMYRTGWKVANAPKRPEEGKGIRGWFFKMMAKRAGGADCAQDAIGDSGIGGILGYMLLQRGPQRRRARTDPLDQRGDSLTIECVGTGRLEFRRQFSDPSERGGDTLGER